MADAALPHAVPLADRRRSSDHRPWRAEVPFGTNIARALAARGSSRAHARQLLHEHHEAAPRAPSRPDDNKLAERDQVGVNSSLAMGAVAELSGRGVSERSVRTCSSVK